MMWIKAGASVLLTCCTVGIACAQVHNPGMQHTPGMQHPGGASSATPAQGRALPTQSGQSAYSAIGEIVRILEADPATDWSKVNIERLRLHLVDMDDVTLRARVAQTPIPGGARMDVTGEGPTVDAIRRMVRAHSTQPDVTSEALVQVEDIPGGARLVVTARQAGDARMEAKIRGLGFAGLLTRGDHHAPHHLGMASGSMQGHGH